MLEFTTELKWLRRTINILRVLLIVHIEAWRICFTGGTFRDP